MDQKIGREEFERKLRFKMPPSDIELVMDAYRDSKILHGYKNQTRESGERYFEHPKAVALILMGLGICDRDMIIAALSHDVAEDCLVFGDTEKAIANIKKKFGERPASFVSDLTKRSCEPERKDVRDIAYHANLWRATVEVRIIKLADRLHNLRSLAACSAEKQQRYLAETETYFIPLAKDVAHLFPQFLKELRNECDAAEFRIRQNENGARTPQPFLDNGFVRTEEST